MSMSSDAKAIADAFRQIHDAAMSINQVLLDNVVLSYSIPNNWPLHMSAYEFAAQCATVADEYDAIAESDVASPDQAKAERRR